MKKDTRNSFLGILLLVFCIIIFFELLNYFNIISLSALYPKLFGFLPHRTTQSSGLNSNSSNSSVVTLPIKIVCPAPISPCTGKDMFRNNAYAGIGFTVKNGYPISAAIPGTITFRDRNATKGSIFFLPDDVYILGSGNAKNYVAVYDFIGDKLGKNFIDNVLQGQPIATASPGSLIDFQDSKRVNLIFRIQDLNGRVLPLSSSNFQ